MLRDEHILILSDTEVDDAPKDFIRNYYRSHLNGTIQPVWLSAISNLADEADDSIYLAIRLTQWHSYRKRPVRDCALVRIPRDLDRFVRLPDRDGCCCIMYLDDVIRICMSLVFVGQDFSQFEAYAFKFTKDAEMEIDNDPECGKLQKVQRGVRSRKRGEPMRVIYDGLMPRDLFLHVPYQSFDGYIRFLREAAISPSVRSVKTTLYRLARDSHVVSALITAAKNGKKVTVVIELFARFDESSNIKWSKRMQDAGIEVIFGVDGLKVHSKITLVETATCRLACIGTGNFHEGNARLYTDCMLFTSARAITKDVANVFDFIRTPYLQPKFKELVVSPVNMRDRLVELIDNEARNARRGVEAYIMVKTNHVTDVDIIRRLNAAREAGVRVGMMVRGNCSMMCADGVRGIIDRYLEHARILIFANGGDEKFFMGSADWMPRNLDNRIEADGRTRPASAKLLFLRFPLRLGDDVFVAGSISPARVKKMCRMIKAFRQLMRLYGVASYRACATSAMREAANGREVARLIKRRTGVRIEIISGSTEASVICDSRFGRAVVSQPDVAMVDVGGGSTEVSLTLGGRKCLLVSFNVGTIRLLHQTDAQRAQALSSLASDLASRCVQLLPQGGVDNVGSGGNINKLR